MVIISSGFFCCSTSCFDQELLKLFYSCSSQHLYSTVASGHRLWPTCARVTNLVIFPSQDCFIWRTFGLSHPAGLSAQFTFIALIRFFLFVHMVMRTATKTSRCRTEAFTVLFVWFCSVEVSEFVSRQKTTIKSQNLVIDSEQNHSTHSIQQLSVLTDPLEYKTNLEE